ncbi:MAG: MtrB/PioB family outer membrane beta-barrel protein [Vicinamibacterales bacterium]
MRNRLIATTAALLLSSQLGMAQTPPAGQATPPEAPAWLGSIDFGGALQTTDGDEARFERYRDSRNGAFSNITLAKTTDRYLFNARAWHVGFRDQSYGVDYMRRRLAVSFMWDSLPLNYSYLTQTPWTVNDNGVLTLSSSARAAVQGPSATVTNDGTAVGVPCAPGALPASCSTVALATQAKANRSIYASLAEQFDMRVQRHTTGGSVVVGATNDLDVSLSFLSAAKTGHMPWGASFAFNNANELPLPIDNRTNDFSAGVAWTRPKGMFRLGWDGSWFNNSVQTLTWDNPIRLTDFTNGLLPPSGPYDASGYSNGNGPAQGRMALAPSNTSNVFSVTGLYKLPARTSLNGTLQFTSQNQNEALIPWTINPVINTASVFAAFPHLRALPRSTAEAEAKGLNALINLSSRPSRYVSITARYRYNERDNQTPVFDATEYVRFDAVPEEIEEGLSHQYDTTRQNLDTTVTFSPSGLGAVRLGYGHEAYERHGRGFSEVSENVVRLSYDALTHPFFTLRAGVDYGQRTGTGFVEQGVDYETGPGGTQPGLRYYDEADRKRTRGNILLTANPTDVFDVYFMYAGGKDEYEPGDTVPAGRSFFGLLDSSIHSWNVGANVAAGKVLLGATVGRDRFGALQKSRNANPPPDAQWTDPSRDWTLDNDETVNNFTLYVDLLRAITNTDVRIGYDYSDSDNAFVHGGPRIASLSAAGQFIALPNVENTWHRLTADVKYFFTTKVGVGLGYYFEKLDVIDFNTIDSNGPVGFADATGDVRIDWLGALTTGYGNRHYSGNNVYLRLLYLF